MAILIMALSSCKDKSTLLLRSWRLEDMKYTREIPKEMRPAFDRSIAEMKNSLRLTYHADGTYVTQVNQSELNGTWKLNWNSSKITSTSDSGEKKEYTIVELSSTRYSFKAMEGKNEVLFVMVPEK